MTQDLNETKLIRWIIFIPILGVMLTSFILTNIFISSKKESHEAEIQNIQKIHIINLKNTIQERIEHISVLLDNNYKQQIKESKKSIKELTLVAGGFLKKVYENNKHLNKKDLYKKIDESMREIRFFKDNMGYFFIYDLQDGTSISLPSAPNLVGTSLKKLTDLNGKNLFDSFGKILLTSNEGYDEWYWNKPQSQKKVKKLGYIKKFEPLNIAFGTAIYFDDIEEEIKKSAKSFIQNLQYKDDSYIFVMNAKGTAILHKNKSIIGVKIENFENSMRENIKNIVQHATKTNGAFLEYTQSTDLFNHVEMSKKISYVKHLPFLNWIIGTGLYTNDLKKQVERKQKLLEEKLENDIKTILIISLMVTALIVILFIFISNRIKNIFHFYSKQLSTKHNELQKLNDNLEQKVKTQVKKSRQKDKILYQQSKMASMGEMLGNIAHQWRQPLSSISAAASGILVQKKFGQLTQEHMNHSLNNIVKNTMVLSQTIDDFRDFYKTDKNEEKFKIKNMLQKVLMLIDANLKNKEIHIVKNIDDIEIYGLENELVQAILNIINNARDALIDFNIQKEKYIFIDIFKEEECLIINIKDNAGGIKDKFLNKIFEPYFTTKHKAQGTGIGLYMTHEIITENLKGSIEIANSTYIYQDISYTGALFTVKLPIGKIAD